MVFKNCRAISKVKLSKWCCGTKHHVVVHHEDLAAGEGCGERENLYKVQQAAMHSFCKGKRTFDITARASRTFSGPPRPFYNGKSWKVAQNVHCGYLGGHFLPLVGGHFYARGQQSENPSLQCILTNQITHYECILTQIRGGSMGGGLKRGRTPHYKSLVKVRCSPPPKLI